MTTKVEILEPVEGGKVVYQRIAPATVGGPAQARVSLLIRIRNLGKTSIEISSIELQGKVIGRPMDPDTGGGVVIKPGSRFDYQNADSLALTIDEAHLSGLVPLVVRMNGPESPFNLQHLQMVPHVNDNGPLAFPGIADELGPNEVWSASSDHGAGHQVFALDMGVRGWDPHRKLWVEELPKTNGEVPEHFRIYGMPVHAMSDGQVCFALNDHAEWASRTSRDQIVAAAKAAAEAIGPGTPLDTSTFPQSATFGGYGGGGNVIFIKAAGEICLYAHFQPGSIPPELMKVGAPVRRGQYLGKVGWSGDSGHPHLHIHVKKGPGSAPDPKAASNGCDSGVIRPMAFNELRSLPIDGAPSPANSKRELWAKLTNHSAPKHPGGLLYPGSFGPPMFPDIKDARQYIGVWHPGDHIELRVRSFGFDSFVEFYKKLVRDSFRLTKISPYFENNRQCFLGVYRRSGGAEFLSKMSPWKAFVEHAQELTADGKRLLDVCTYVEGSTRWFVGVFGAGPGGLAPAFVDGFKDFKKVCDDFAKQNFNLVSLTSFVPTSNNHFKYIGVFSAKSQPQRIVTAGNFEKLVGKVMELGGGFRLHDVASEQSFAPRLVGVCLPDTKKQGQMIESVTGYDAFRQHCEKNARMGFRLARAHVQGTGLTDNPV